MKRNYIELFFLWVRSYFKHPLENIRQAKPIIPGRLYRNFGNVCKAVPYSKGELTFIETAAKGSLLKGYCDGISLLEYVRSVGGNKEMVKTMQQTVESMNDLPPRCSLCDFHKYGIPCPAYNILEDGSTVCDSHKYIIIKRAVNNG